MYKIKQFAEMAGVTVRMLRHYDKIGLLVPEKIHPFTGYRYYGDKNLQSIQHILFFKALDFSLNEVKDIITDTSLDHEAILSMQRNLLNMQKDRLSKMIRFIDDLLNQGVTDMKNQMKSALNKDQFDQQKLAYANEAKQKWGLTTSYQQSQKKLSQYSQQQIAQLVQQQQNLYQNLAEMIHLDITDQRVQKKIHKARMFINDNWYACDLKQFSALGAMYVNDERFRKNLDQHGTGLAEFLSQGINHYCRSVLSDKF